MPKIVIYCTTALSAKWPTTHLAAKVGSELRFQPIDATYALKTVRRLAGIAGDGASHDKRLQNTRLHSGFPGIDTVAG
ncbi:MAG: hypothetical protein ACSHXD_18480 [Marinosulfonomonas sp.]